jgi:hypothetical protein
MTKIFVFSIRLERDSCLGSNWCRQRQRAEIKIKEGDEIFKKINHSRKRRQKGNRRSSGVVQMTRKGTRPIKKKKGGVGVKCHLPREFEDPPTTSPFRPSDILNKSRKIKPKCERDRELGPFESE